MTVYGFTGPRDLLLTPRQNRALTAILHPGDIWRWGRCKGKDDDAAGIARRMGCYLIAHPSNLRDWQGIVIPDEMLPPKPPLERNRDFCALVDVLIAAPRSMQPETTGGTWYTIRWAQRIGLPVVYLEP